MIYVTVHSSEAWAQAQGSFCFVYRKVQWLATGHVSDWQPCAILWNISGWIKTSLLWSYLACRPHYYTTFICLFLFLYPYSYSVMINRGRLVQVLLLHTFVVFLFYIMNCSLICFVFDGSLTRRASGRSVLTVQVLQLCTKMQFYCVITYSHLLCEPAMNKYM